MKILVVTQHFWPENFLINDLVSGLSERGHTVTILTGIPNYPEVAFSWRDILKNMRQRYHGAEVIRVPLIPRGSGRRFRLAANYASFAFFAGILAPFVCRGKYDAIFVYEPSPITVGIPAIILKKIKSAPILFWVQDLWPESLSVTGAVKSKFFLKMVKGLVRFIYDRCDLILVQSRAFMPSILSFGVESKKVHYFPNSAEDFYRPVEVESGAVERKEVPSGFVVMFAGNIGVSQDFATILSAAEKLRDQPDIYWVIIGDGRMRRWAEGEATSRNLIRNFIFLGRRPAESIPRYFALSGALLVTLKKADIFSFTVPAKVQSYLACARPIISSLTGEGARIIEEAKAGFSCYPEDGESLAQSVLKVYHMSEDQRREMGLRGRKYFEDNFRRDRLLDQLDEKMAGLKKVRA